MPLQKRGHRLDRHAVIRIGPRLAETAKIALFHFHDQRALHTGRAVVDRKRVAQRQIALVERKFHDGRVSRRLWRR